MYIGQSINIEKRWRGHKCELNHNRHRNGHLQNAWNKYGEENFMFSVLEECQRNELDEKEIYWIDRRKTTTDDCGYNMQYGGSSGLHTEEYKIYMKEKMKGNTNGGLGETNGQSKITENQALRVINMLIDGLQASEIHKKTCVSLGTIKHIRQKDTWAYLTTNIIFPVKEMYKKAWKTRRTSQNTLEDHTCSMVSKREQMIAQH